MPRPVVNLLPPVAELQYLDPAVAQSAIQAIESENQREHRYASLGMICGTLSFLACIVAFSFLVLRGHSTAAGVILGTGVLAIVGRMIAARL